VGDRSQKHDHGTAASPESGRSRRRSWVSPLTRKRFRRFRETRRAWYALCLLIALYVVSLCAELICNDVPLLVRCNGRLFVPILQACTEDDLLHNGRKNRPDFKKIRRSAAFRDGPGNFMIFPPVPFGPNEIIDPADIRIPDRVIVRLGPDPRTARLDVRPDWTIARAEGGAAFLGSDDEALRGRRLTEFLDPPDGCAEALRLRLENRSAPRFVATARVLSDGRSVLVHMPPFRPREHSPQTVRVLLRETPPDDRRERRIVFGRDGRPVGGRIRFWNRLPADVRKRLVARVRRRFDLPVEDMCFSLDRTGWRAAFEREEVRFPFRPTREHWLGLDSAGRDVFARLLYGLRTSLTFGLLLVAATAVVGVVIGGLQGYYGGKLDITCQRFIEIWAALPFLYVMILLGATYGRSFVLLLVCYGLFNWIGISYYVRAEFLRLRRLPFVEAARCLGVPARRIIFRHILPNALVPVITFLPFSLVGAIGSLAALDYLGFGLPPPTPSWGELLHQAQQFRWAWWLILYPSLGLFCVMLLGVFIGEGARNAWDPRRFSRLE